MTGLTSRSLAKLELRGEVVRTLGVQCADVYLGAPDVETVLQVRDTLILTGHTDRLEDLDHRPEGHTEGARPRTGREKKNNRPDRPEVRSSEHPRCARSRPRSKWSRDGRSAGCHLSSADERPLRSLIADQSSDELLIDAPSAAARQHAWDAHAFVAMRKKAPSETCESPATSSSRTGFIGRCLQVAARWRRQDLQRSSSGAAPYGSKPSTVGDRRVGVPLQTSQDLVVRARQRSDRLVRAARRLC